MKKIDEIKNILRQQYDKLRSKYKVNLNYSPFEPPPILSGMHE